LCEDFKGNCVGTYQYKTNTDKNGYYVLDLLHKCAIIGT